MPANQANIDKHEQERWEDLLTTVSARQAKIDHVEISSANLARLIVCLMGAQYSQQIIDRLNNGDQGYLWQTPIVIDDNCNWAKIVYKDGVMSPEPSPKKDNVKPIDLWLDDEV